jgi:hypothetical protein
MSRSEDHMARCQAMRGGVTESEALIIADLAAIEKEADRRVTSAIGAEADMLARAEAAESTVKRLREACSALRTAVEGLRERRHSGTGRLVYTGDTDEIGKCWCEDCKQWIAANKWSKPCLSTQERRKGERRYPHVTALQPEDYDENDSVSTGTEGLGEKRNGLGETHVEFLINEALSTLAHHAHREGCGGEETGENSCCCGLNYIRDCITGVRAALVQGGEKK